jgi:hypothetical protein
MNRFMSNLSYAGIALIFLTIGSAFASQPTSELLPTPTIQDKELLESSQALAQQITAVEWLGPMAPVALSPFFGLACLSGIATYGPEWLQQRSAIFGDSSPLNNPILFLSMVVLTIITSLPRFSKVSKPLALAAEKLEAYSVVIIVIAMRMFAPSGDGTEAVSAGTPLYLSAGIASIPFDLAVAIASAINILVINGVKLFCEFIIWLTPLPLIDALAEATNKMLCVGLMSLYCWSPLIATIVNLSLLAICGCVYWWTQRRIVYYINLLLGPWLKGGLPWLFADNKDGEKVFLAERWNGVPAYTKMRLQGSAGSNWILTHYRWWNRVEHRLPTAEIRISAGLLAETIRLLDESSQCVVLHRRNTSS